MTTTAALLVLLSGVAVAAASGPSLLRLAPGSPDGGWWQTIGSPGASVGIGGDASGDANSDAASGATTVRLEFRLPPPTAWAGVVVLAAPDGWGNIPGPAFDLSRASRLTLRLRGQAGGERIRLKVATAGDLPYGDSAPLPFDSGWLTLSADWQRFDLPLDGRRLGRVVTPLVVIANHQHNPAGRITVWLADIRFEAADD